MRNVLCIPQPPGPHGAPRPVWRRDVRLPGPTPPVLRCRSVRKGPHWLPDTRSPRGPGGIRALRGHLPPARPPSPRAPLDPAPGARRAPVRSSHPCNVADCHVLSGSRCGPRGAISASGKTASYVTKLFYFLKYNYESIGLTIFRVLIDVILLIGVRITPALGSGSVLAWACSAWCPRATAAPGPPNRAPAPAPDLHCCFSQGPRLPLGRSAWVSGLHVFRSLGHRSRKFSS